MALLHPQQLASESGGLTLGELQQVLEASVGAQAAAKLRWALSPLEYLARRRGQQHMSLGKLQVAALLPYTLDVLQCCMQVVEASPEPQAAAGKAAAFASSALTVLTLPGVQQRLRSCQSVLQEAVASLEAALAHFKQQQQQGLLQPEQYAGGIANRLPAAAPAAELSFAAKMALHPSTGDQPSARTATGTSIAATTGKGPGLSLATLLSSHAPAAGLPNSLSLPGFPQLLLVWAHLVYGELARPDDVQVAPLLLYHWRTLLRLLRMCLQGAAELPGYSSQGPMPIRQAISLVDSLLLCLACRAVAAQFTPAEHQVVTFRLAAFRSILLSIPQPAAGQPPAIDSFCSAAVEEHTRQQLEASASLAAASIARAHPGTQAGHSAAVVDEAAQLLVELRWGGPQACSGLQQQMQAALS